MSSNNIDSVKNHKISAIIYADSAKFFAQKDICNDGIITVTGVDVSASSKHATIWVALINLDEEAFVKRITGLENLLKRYISQTKSFQYVPSLHIKVDQSGESSQKLYKLLEG